VNPFKSNIPVVQNVIFENDGDTVTIIHSKGAYKFNKEDVLESHFSCDLHSSPKMNVSLFHFNPKSLSTVFIILFFGGWLNTLFVLYSKSFLPVGSPYPLIFLAILLSFFTLYFFRFLMKYVHVRYDNNFPKILFFKSLYELDVTKDYRKDILNISLNNSNLRVRFEWYNRGIKTYKGDYEKLESWYDSMIDLGYLKESSTSRVIIPNQIFSSRKNFIFYRKMTFAAVIIFVLFTRWDMPFILRDFIDDQLKFIFPEFPTLGNLNTEEGKILFREYVRNSNLFWAFYDGMVGVLFNASTIFLAVISFIWPLLIANSMVIVLNFVFKISWKYILIPSIFLFGFYLVSLLFLYHPKEMVYYWKVHLMIGFIIGVILLFWIMLVGTANFKEQDN
jgi:hypothetical protein